MMNLSKIVWNVCDSQMAEALLQQFPSLESVLNYSAAIISKGSQSEVLPISLNGMTFYIKRYFKTTGIRSWFGASRLRVEKRNQQRFNRWGLNTATIAAYGEKYHLIHTLKGAMITVGIENSVDLEQVAMKQPMRLKDPLWVKTVSQQVARAARLLHQKRFCHNDFFLRNLLVQQNDDSQPKLYLIDCPSGRYWFGYFLYQRKVKDIASLNKHAQMFLTNTQRLRFMLSYFDTDKLDRHQKKFIRDVLAYEAKRQKRKQRFINQFLR